MSERKIQRVAVIGPESSGKSELCEKLAAHYNTVWVEEHARRYLPKLDSKYTIDDIVTIYKTQFENELKLLAIANKYLFIDTEFIIAKVWCEHAFGICPGYIESMIEKHPYDLYLLTSPDLPWQFDPLRENEGKGNYFFEWYKNILEEKSLPYRIVSGTGNQRFRNAVDLLTGFPAKK